jgi:release factor glutamine methyltransferase
VTSTCDFGPLIVGYDGRVLAPRPWTLVQSELATDRLRHTGHGPVVELHAGAGHIGQVVAARSGRMLVQVDDDAAACCWAARNASANGIHAFVVHARVERPPLRDAQAALVLADPPYVPSAEATQFPLDPRHAIDGGTDGHDGIAACLPTAERLLRPGGALVLQVRGPGQVEPVERLAQRCAPHLQLDDVVLVAVDRAVVALRRD